MLSERVKRVGAMFGVEREESAWGARLEMLRWAAALVNGMLRAGEVGLVGGASGAGKSTVGRELARRCGAMVVGGDRRRSTDLRRNRKPVERVVDLFSAGLREAMGHLSRAGLGEARVMVARVRELSEGQRARLGIALGMEWAEAARGEGGRAPTLVLDEFCSTLDRVTAMGVARMVGKWARGSGVRVVCITGHEDVAAWLGAGVVVEVGEGGVRVAKWGGAATGRVAE